MPDEDTWRPARTRLARDLRTRNLDRMSSAAGDRRPVRVEADQAQIEAPLDQAVTAVLDEGLPVSRVWTAEDFGDSDWDHPDTRPRMRGWLHLFAFFGAIVAGAVLIPLASAQGARAGLSTGLYCLTICGLFGISALYHRRRWSPRGWKVMKRLDHSMIFLFIAGTYTPFALLAVDQPTGYWVLGVVWVGAVAGVALKLSWPTAPRWVGVPLYLALGWVAVFVLTDILHIAGVASLVLLAVGGILYTVGGIAYAIKKPNPWPGVFGYHEVFHAMTIVAAICHYIAVYFAVYHSPFL
jgi:hemolysin III